MQERLKQSKKARTPFDAERTKLESLPRNVPDGLQLDRLLKYEASISREIDRTLTQGAVKKNQNAKSTKPNFSISARGSSIEKSNPSTPGRGTESIEQAPQGAFN